MFVNLNNEFWKTRLSDSERADYERLRGGFTSRQVFGISGLVTTDVNALARICGAVLNDHPEFYAVYADRTPVSVSANGKVSMMPQYISCNGRQFDAEAEKILLSAKNLSTDYEKVLYVKDVIADSVLYDYAALKQANELLEDKRKRLENPESFTAYGAIVNRRATCDGIARAVCFLLRRLGVQCTVTNGKSSNGEPHSWNIVCLNGACYHLDVTNDLLRKELYFERTYHYFLITDAEMLDYFVPTDDGGIICDSVENSYYTRSGLRFDNISSLRRYVLDGAYGEVLSVQYVGKASERYVNALLTSAAIRNATGDKKYFIHSFTGGKYFVLIKSKYEIPKRRRKGE